MIACLFLLIVFGTDFEGWLFVCLMLCSILFVVNAQMAAEDIGLVNWIFTPRELFDSPIAFIAFAVSKNTETYWLVIALVIYLLLRHLMLHRRNNWKENA